MQRMTFSCALTCDGVGVRVKPEVTVCESVCDGVATGLDDCVCVMLREDDWRRGLRTSLGLRRSRTARLRLRLTRRLA